jgi:GT2 family glycosyltransferase
MSPELPSDHPRLGVVVVTYRAADYIAECLESLLGTGYANLRIVVVDNDSPDATSDVVRAWASGKTPFTVPDDWPFPDFEPATKPVSFHERRPGDEPALADHAVTLIESGGNLGFAGGVNVGLRALLSDPEIDMFWVLNPDAISEPQTPFCLVKRAREMGRFAVIGGRMLVRDDPDYIQLDAGRIRKLTGMPVAMNLGASASRTPLAPDDQIDFISGGSMLASREFIDRAGLMEEKYFLYFEEIDWQLRRGDLPLSLAPGGEVRHQVGASIGSGGRSLKPHPFAVYFGARAQIRFVLRWWPHKLPIAYLQAFLRFPRHMDGSLTQLLALLCGIHGLAPPKAVRKMLPETVWKTILK